MSVQEQAIEKINAEMQKDPGNAYLEILGHYIIDRCADEQVAQAAMSDKKTLKGCIDSIRAVAQKKQSAGVGVMTDREIYDAADKYFSLERDAEARAEHKRSVDGDPLPEQSKSNIISLGFDSFL